MAVIIVSIATVVIATGASVPNGLACVIAAQAIAVAIADAAGVAGTTVPTAATVTAAIATAVTTTTTTTTLRVGGAHDGQISGQ